jgi:hypothetical protein
MTQLKFDEEPQEAEWYNSYIRLYAMPSQTAFFFSVLLENNITLTEFVTAFANKAAKSYEDSEEVRKNFRHFLSTVNLNRFGRKSISKKRAEHQAKIKAMYKEVTEKEQGWSKDELKQLYELFEEIQEEVNTEIDEN